MNKKNSRKKYKQEQKWLPFEDARKFAHSLGLKNRKEWNRYLKGEIPGLPQNPDNIPRLPHKTYRYEGWSGYVDWFGRERKNKWRNFKLARRFVRTLKLENVKQWKMYYKRQIKDKGVCPSDIPANPDRVYKNKGWISWNDWIGNAIVEHRNRIYYPFTDAREYARSLHLTSQSEWYKLCRGELNGSKKPDFIPDFPYEIYSDTGWISWNDFLGIKALPKHKRKYRSLSEAKKFVHGLKFKNTEQWAKYCKGKIINRKPLPDDIPACPAEVYKDWISWGDFLGTDIVATRLRKFLSFEEARQFAQNLNLSGEHQWRLFCAGKLPDHDKKPANIPYNPCKVYKDWISWGDFLGTGHIHPGKRKYRTFTETREFARKLKLGSQKQWKRYCTKKSNGKISLPDDIPASPHVVYKSKGWISWGDFLGTGYISNQKRNYRTFEEARSYIRKLRLKSNKEWRQYLKGEIRNKPLKPADIPTNPDCCYRGKGWISWPDFLGTEDFNKHEAVYREIQKIMENIEDIK